MKEKTERRKEKRNHETEINWETGIEMKERKKVNSITFANKNKSPKSETT